MSESSRRLVTALITVSLAGCSACGGSFGQIAGRQPDARFVTEKATLFVSSAFGIERIGLDGSDRGVVFGRTKESSWSVFDVSADFRTFLLETSRTELFIGDVATGTLRQVTALGRRVSTARLSPDGKRFAAARHSDYDTPGSKEDDTLYIGDVATLAIEELPKTSAQWPSTLRWAKDGTGVWVSMSWEGKAQWVTLADKKRRSDLERAPVPLDDGHHPSPPACPEKPISPRWSTTLRMVAPDASSESDGGRVVVEVKGRKRGWHDYQSDFYDLQLSPKCSYVVFGWHGEIWVAEARGSGLAAPLLIGGVDALFFEPPVP